MPQSPLVLVIDDDESIQHLLAHALERDGLRVLTAGSGADGLAALERERPDVVLLDIRLPDISGREVCRQIRLTSSMPVIMLTALDDEADKVAALDLGADDYITKPFGLRELRSRVRAVLRRSVLTPPAGVGERLSRAGVDLDLGRRTAAVNGNAIELTYVEFEILRTLMAAPNHVFSRRQLLDGVWGSSEFREPRTVDVHIRHLREKIEPDASAPTHIHTVRGVGYRFVG